MLRVSIPKHSIPKHPLSLSLIIGGPIGLVASRRSSLPFISRVVSKALYTRPSTTSPFGLRRTGSKPVSARRQSAVLSVGSGGAAKRFAPRCQIYGALHQCCASTISTGDLVEPSLAQPCSDTVDLAPAVVVVLFGLFGPVSPSPPSISSLVLDFIK